MYLQAGYPLAGHGMGQEVVEVTKPVGKSAGGGGDQDVIQHNGELHRGEIIIFFGEGTSMSSSAW